MQKIFQSKSTTAIFSAVVLFFCVRTLSQLIVFLLSERFVVMVPEAILLSAEKNHFFAFSLALPLSATLLISVAGFLFLSYFFFHADHKSNWLVVGYACIVAGGLANFFDRLTYGFVWDYLIIQFFGLRGAWNLADILIISGSAVWAWGFWHERKESI